MTLNHIPNYWPFVYGKYQQVVGDLKHPSAWSFSPWRWIAFTRHDEVWTTKMNKIISMPSDALVAESFFDIFLHVIHIILIRLGGGLIITCQNFQFWQVCSSDGLLVCLCVCVSVRNFFDTGHSFWYIFTKLDPSMYLCHVTMPIVFLGQKSNN